MTSTDPLKSRFPGLDRRLNKVSLANLPTPVRELSISHAGKGCRVWIKQDNLTGEPYGGNKVRKLEYLFGRLRRKGCERVATFGAVGSNHALATALYARRLHIDPICFLSHQASTPLAALALNMHLANRSEIVAFGGPYAARLKMLREHLWNRSVDVIPMGGSSWIGTIGLINAGLELANQIAVGELPRPDRIYLATGTMGTAAGLALGLALAEQPIELHAVRVSHTAIANESVLQRLLQKTVHMLHREEPSFPEDLADRTRVFLRHEYFAPGYAHSNQKTDAAIELAANELGLELESTYTGKAMAALIDDLSACESRGQRVLFWNTYHSAALPASTDAPLDTTGLPGEFLSYFG